MFISVAQTLFFLKKRCTQDYFGLSKTQFIGFWWNFHIYFAYIAYPNYGCPAEFRYWNHVSASLGALFEQIVREGKGLWCLCRVGPQAVPWSASMAVATVKLWRWWGKKGAGSSLASGYASLLMVSQPAQSSVGVWINFSPPRLPPLQDHTEGVQESGQIWRHCTGSLESVILSLV